MYRFNYEEREHEYTDVIATYVLEKIKDENYIGCYVNGYAYGEYNYIDVVSIYKDREEILDRVTNCGMTIISSRDITVSELEQGEDIKDATILVDKEGYLDKVRLDKRMKLDMDKNQAILPIKFVEGIKEKIYNK